MGMEMIGFPCPFCIDFSAGGMNMDSMDRSILKCLSENSRQSATEISQTVHLSVAAVIERIRKLERNGIIRQYTVVADQHKIGNDVTALMEVSLEHPKYYDEFTKVMHDDPMKLLQCLR